MQVQNPALHCVTARRNSAGDAGQGRGCGSGAGRREGLKGGEKREGVRRRVARMKKENGGKERD